LKMSSSITAPELYNIVLGWLRDLERHRDEVDALNVFPVPDGDTGTNMYLTLQSVVNEVNATSDNTIAGYSRAIKDGSLKGARGNSGVILSQILRGMTDVIVESGDLDAKVLAKAITGGANVAYEAVMKPVEGTMLTVIKDMGRAARRASRKQGEIADFLRAIVEEGKESLARTPELLNTLKEAGVVDAGGKGLLVLAESTLATLTGDTDWVERPVEFAVSPADFMAGTVSSEPEVDLEYTYCTEFFLKGQNIDAGQFRDQIAPLGGSLMVVADGPLVKTHIHTNDPGAVLSAATTRGELSGLKIDNMREQTAANAGKQTAPAAAAERKAVGVVAIAVGDGIKDILRSLGVVLIVDGGQTMNPSTEDIVKAVEAAPADSVIILPNNKNIILTAKQAATLTDKQVYVVPTTSAPQAFSALIAYDESKSLNENGPAMDAAAALVKTGEVTTASRDSKVNKKKVTKGDIIGVASGSLIAGGGTVAETALKLIKAMADEDTEVITLIKGADLDAAEIPKLVEKLAKKFPEADTNVYEGGQPLYPLIIGVE
jgi:uncharacterized protein